MPSLPRKSWQKDKRQQQKPRRQGWEKSNLLRKWKAKTGGTEKETFFFSMPSVAVGKQAEKIKKQQRQNALTSSCENKMKFLSGLSGFSRLKRTRALQRSVALGSRHGSRGIISVTKLFAEFPGMAAIQFKFSGEGGRKKRDEYVWCLYFTF